MTQNTESGLSDSRESETSSWTKGNESEDKACRLIAAQKTIASSIQRTDPSTKRLHRTTSSCLGHPSVPKQTISPPPPKKQKIMLTNNLVLFEEDDVFEASFLDDFPAFNPAAYMESSSVQPFAVYEPIEKAKERPEGASVDDSSLAMPHTFKHAPVMPSDTQCVFEMTASDRMLSLLNIAPFEQDLTEGFSQQAEHDNALEKAMNSDSKSLQFERKQLAKRQRTQRVKELGEASTASSLVSDTNPSSSNHFKCWSIMEEIFLVGVVMDRFFRRGALTAANHEDGCWTEIKHLYDQAWTRYNTLHNKEIPAKRSMKALARHYKVMKSKITQADIKGDRSSNFRAYLKQWEEVYNVDQCLLSSCSPSGSSCRASTSLIS